MNDPDECMNYLINANNSLAIYSINGEDWYLANHNYMLIQYHLCLSRNPRPLEPRSCSAPCERDCEEMEDYLDNFRLVNWGTYELIDNQGIWEDEFCLRADVMSSIETSESSNRANTTLTYVSPCYKKSQLLSCGSAPCSGNLKHVDYRWWVDWKEDVIASPVVVNWTEYDDTLVTTPISQNFTVGAKIGPATISRTISLGFNRVGERTVDLGLSSTHYCDPILKDNYTGQIYYQLD